MAKPKTGNQNEPLMTEPPPPLGVYLVVEGEVGTEGSTPEEIEREIIFILQLKVFFDLTDVEIKRIDEDLVQNKRAFVRYYVPQIAGPKADKANKTILKSTCLKAEVG